MNFLILGDGPDERAWIETITGSPEHRVVAAFPGFPDLAPEVVIPGDLEAALVASGVDAAIVGGPLELRDEWLRRVAANGYPTICLHPPGANADPYYQVALSREETGAVVVPDMPGRLHPAVVTLRDALVAGELGVFRGLKIEVPGDRENANLAAWTFPRWVDVARVFLGEVESLTAIGDPPGLSPTQSLTVQLRGGSGRLAEVRLDAGSIGKPARLILSGETGRLVLEVDPSWTGPAVVAWEDGPIREIGSGWNPRQAVLDVLGRAVAGEPVRPNLLDGTRAMEVASAVARGLKRGRAVDLNYEEVSETGNFKTMMTSVGCMLLLGILVALPLALVGPALGIGQTIYIAYAIPPILVVFAVLQTLRLAIKPGPPSSPNDSSD
jgi:predicted dehydrogenase